MMEALSTASAAHLIHSLLFNNQSLPCPLQKQPPEAPCAHIAGQHFSLGSSLPCFPLHTQTCSRTLRNPSGCPKTSYLKVAEVEEGCRAVGEAQGHLGAAGELVGRCLGRRTEGAASWGGHHGICLTGGTLSGTLLTRIPPHGEPPKMGDPSSTRGRFPTQRGEGTPNRGGTQHEGTLNTEEGDTGGM